MSPKELRKLSGAGEILAARLAHVSRETIRAYEVDPRLVKTPAKRWLCEMYYADIAARLALAEERARIVDDGMFPESAAA